MPMLRYIEHWDFAVHLRPNKRTLMSHGIKPSSGDSTRSRSGKFHVIERDEARKRLGLPLTSLLSLTETEINLANWLIKQLKLLLSSPKTKRCLPDLRRERSWLGNHRTFRNRDASKRSRPTAKLAVTPGINYMAAPPMSNLIHLQRCDIGINTANGEGWGLSRSSTQCAKTSDRTSSYFMSRHWW